MDWEDFVMLLDSEILISKVSHRVFGTNTMGYMYKDGF